MNMSQVWHDLISELESTVAPVKHLFDEHQQPFDAAVKNLRDQADQEVGHLVGDAEAAGKTALGQVEADAAPVIAEAEQDAADLAHTAESDLHDVVSSDSAPAPAQGTEQSTPETAA